MHIWLDTIDCNAIERAKNLGLLHGVTTNPSILAKTSKPAEHVLENVLNHFSGPIAVQVTQTTASEMVEQGKDLLDFSSRIIVKVPVTQEGLEAIHWLRHLDIPTMATAIFEPMQAYLAAEAGACYVVPYFAHIKENARLICQSIQNYLKNSQTKLLVASVKTKEDVEFCLSEGFSAVTLKPEVFQTCIAIPPQTHEHVKRFTQAWQEAPTSHLLSSSQYI